MLFSVLDDFSNKVIYQYCKDNKIFEGGGGEASTPQIP